MGAYAGRAMVSDSNGELDQLVPDFCFEMFAHSTKFFNYKVIRPATFHILNIELFLLFHLFCLRSFYWVNSMLKALVMITNFY